MTGVKIRAATDVGGTFTDLVLLIQDPTTGRQDLLVEKVDTTPPHFEVGVLNVLHKVAVPIRDIEWLSHGTTLVINSITERRGAKVALITTEGFRDVLEIARGDRPNFFNLIYRKPTSFVPRYLRREVSGRIDYRGNERRPLDLSGLPAIVADFKHERVEAIAVCLLHSYANDAHEKRVMLELARLWPEIPAVASHQIVREWREYERTSTTVLSAYVLPVANQYLERLERGVRAEGFSGPLYIMQSNCGVSTVETARSIPVTMVESGPASGVWGAAAMGARLGMPNVLALDIGGTTAKCSLIEGGNVKVITDYYIERNEESPGYPIKTPVIDLVEIGNGGGSIAWVDDFGRLHVGPRSAGAVPGPVAYGRGGDQPTTTDANLMLGRINRDYFCSGAINADMAGVEAAFARLGERIRVTPIEVARGVVRIANHNMVDALKLVSINRGYDPRDFVLIAFGGGGGMHASALAAELGIQRIVIPRQAAVFSAWGMLMSDLRRDFFKTYLCDLTDSNFAPLNSELKKIVDEASEAFASDGVAKQHLALRPLARLRYRNQDHSVEIPLPSIELRREDLRTVLVAFSTRYKHEYTYTLDVPVEVVGLHLVVSAEIGNVAMLPMDVSGRSLQDAVKGSRPVDFEIEGVHKSTIYDGSLLEAGMRFAGPAVIELSWTTVVVHPQDRIEVDQYANVHLIKD
jgi:N-methylhydantoinase A